MGSQKAHLDLQGRSLVQWVVDAALGSRVTRTVVVTGHEAGLVASDLADRPVVLVGNPEFAAGMSTSLRAGVRAAGTCDAAIFLLSDQPFVTSALIDRLVEAFDETGATVVRPLAAGRPANPVLIGAPLFPEILEQGGDVGGREVVARHAQDVHLVPVEDSRLCMDIDSPEDYEAAKESA